jgi:hypothetical protein
MAFGRPCLAGQLRVPSLATAPAFAGPMQHHHHQQQPGRAGQGEQGVGVGRRGDQEGEQGQGPSGSERLISTPGRAV